MFDSNLIENLPSDPQEAFTHLESAIRRQIPPFESFHDQSEQWSYDKARTEAQKAYVLELAAFSDVFELDIGVNFEDLLTLTGDDFSQAFEIASYKIKYFSSACAFRLAQKRNSGSSCIYVMSDASKARIHKKLDKIREIINAADLTDLRREALFRKLNSFSAELDKDRTNLEAFATFYVQVKPELIEIAELAEQVDSIWSSISKNGKELWKVIAQRKPKGFLEAPLKKIEDFSNSKGNFDLDDEIPF